MNEGPGAARPRAFVVLAASEALRRHLLGTGDDLLVEASPVDRIWGIGLGATDPRAADPREWLGLNLLGFALVRARAILRGALPEPG